MINHVFMFSVPNMLSFISTNIMKAISFYEINRSIIPPHILT